jgi:hypothetical protein
VEFDDLDGIAMGTASKCPHLKSAACPSDDSFAMFSASLSHFSVLLSFRFSNE